MTFSRLQISFVLLLFSGISNHVLIIPHLINISKRDAWVAVIISFVILVIWIKAYSIIFAKMKDQQHFASWLQMKLGKSVSKIILSLFFIFFFVIGFLTFYDLIVTVKIYFLPNTPTVYLLIPFLLLCIWLALSGLRSIIYTSTILLPIIWVLGHFVALTTMPEKDYSFLFPIFADKEASILGGVIIVLAGSADLLILFFLFPYFKKSVNYAYLFIITLILVALVMGPTLGCITAFGPSLASDLRFPAFEQWRLVQIGGNISHVDSLAVYQLLCGAMIRVALCLFVLPLIFNIQAKVKKNVLIIITTIIYSIIMLLHISDILMQTIIRNYIYPSIFIFGFVSTFVLFITSYIPKKEGQITYET